MTASEAADFAGAEHFRELPVGMPQLAALITVGKSPFGYNLKRDGLPAVVVRAYERVGSDGLIAIARLAWSLDRAPRFAGAVALVEWGMGQYAGRAIVPDRDAGLAQEWAAKGAVLRRHWGPKINASWEQDSFDMADFVDWPSAAQAAEESGRATFTVHKTCDDHPRQPLVYEVDMFWGRWAGGGQ